MGQCPPLAFRHKKVSPVMKTCTYCHESKSTTEYGPNSGRCRVCVRTLSRVRMRSYKLDPAKKAVINRTYFTKHPERVNARSKVYYAVKTGKLPCVRTLSCVDCSGLATQYDHHEGYDKPLSVQPVCLTCHSQRGHVRHEHAHKGPRRSA